MAGDNGLYLSMASVVRSWSMGLGPTCTTNCYSPIYCYLFVCASRESICVALDKLLALVGVMELKKVVIVALEKIALKDMQYSDIRKECILG